MIKMKFKIIFIILLILSVSLIKALVIDSVVVSDEINPGKTSKIIISLKSNEDIEDVSVILNLENLPFAPFNSASEYTINEIEEDKTKSAEFEIIALNDASSGVYKIPIMTTYFESEDKNKVKKTKNSLISITVRSKPIIDVNIENDLLLKGKKNEVLVRVTNKGLSNSKFLELEIIESNYFDLLSQKKHYLGNIDSDDFDSIKINFFFKERIPDFINLPITVFYKDNLNNEYKENFNIPLKVYTENKAVELGLLKKSRIFSYVIGIILVIILYIIYRKLKAKARVKNKISH